MDWQSRAEKTAAIISKYMQDKDGWKQLKKQKDVTVWSKSSPHWNGPLYKSEAVVHADPETVFSFVDPSPTSPRQKWDNAIKDLQLLEQIDQNVSVIRTITHSAIGGLISSRDFVDLAVTVRTDDYISTNASATEHASCPVTKDKVRGTNHPCAIICHKIPEDSNKTLVTSYIQTDLGGILPQAVVNKALPDNMATFIGSLKQALKEAGKLHNDE